MSKTHLLLENTIELTRTAHHIANPQHCHHVKSINDCASQVVKGSKSLASGADAVNVLGKVVCECDEQIASVISSGFARIVPEAANLTKDIVKCSGPLSVAIGMGFVLFDVAKASNDKKVERLGRGSAKVALSTGATVLGTVVAGPFGAFAGSLLGSFIGECLDPH